MADDIRRGLVTLPTGETATIDIRVVAYSKLITADAAMLTPRVLVETPSDLIATPATVTLTDPVIAGRYILISSNTAPHNLLRYDVYYDSVKSNIFVIPTLESYASLNYIDNSNLEISGYGINFKGDSDGGVPAINAGVAVKSTLAVISSRTNSKVRGGYFEKMITADYNYSHPSMAPSLFINFGTPSALFTTLGFLAPVSVLAYDSLTEYSELPLGTKPITDTGILLARLPL